MYDILLYSLSILHLKPQCLRSAQKGSAIGSLCTNNSSEAPDEWRLPQCKTMMNNPFTKALARHCLGCASQLGVHNMASISYI